jgi:Spy/CpxP family protein refolding chaperone
VLIPFYGYNKLKEVGMKSLKLWILISLLLGAWMVTGRAQEIKGGGMGERPGAGLREGRMRGGMEEPGFQDILRDPDMVKTLALDEGQIAKIKELNTQSQKELIDWNAKLKHSALALADLMGQEEAKEEAVLKALDESSQIRNEISKLRIKHLFAVRAILTPEQRLKARELIKAKMGERRKPGEGKGGKGVDRAAPPKTPPDEQGNKAAE